MVDLVKQKSYDLPDLVQVVKILRGPGGCQWDAAQTHQSIRRNFLEEAYEVAEAIDEGSVDHLKEELGDVPAPGGVPRLHRGGCRPLQPGRRGGRRVQKTHLPPPPRVWRRHRTLHRRNPLQLEELKKQEKGQATQADAVDAVARSLPARGGRKRCRRRPPRWALTGRTCPAPWTSCPRRSMSCRTR